MNPILPITREVILIGGGHTHTLFLKKWGMNPIPGVEVSLISPTAETAYTGMLPGLLAGHYESNDINIDLVKLCRFAGARFLMASVEDIDGSNSSVHIKGRKALHYDIASVDIGVTSSLPVPLCSNGHVHSIKPLREFVEKWECYYSKVKRGLSEANVVIIGGGVGALEIGLAIVHSFKKINLPKYSVSIIDHARILQGLQLKSQRLLIQNLKESSINVIENISVTGIDEKQVFCGMEEPLVSNFTISAIGATPYKWLEFTDLPLIDGFIQVDKTLKVSSFQNLFAVGDCAHFAHGPLPKAGVFAVRQAPVLYSNIRAKLLKRRYKNYIPQKHHLKLISLGRKSALSDYILPSVSGGAVWWLKDRIDKSFMKKFNNLPKMKSSGDNMQLNKEIADQYVNSKPLCGGCGAKIADKTLEKVLSKLNYRTKKNVITGVGDDGAVIRVGTVNQILTTDHLREFNSDLWRFSRIGAIHALGDIWSMAGTPKTAMINLIVPEASSRVQKGWLDQIMDGALSVFEKEDVALIGGHTSVGKEFSIGFSLTGICEKRPTLISGAKPKDLLILTKPIGSGTILAGEMAGISKGLWVANALTWMEKSQKKAARILSEANAMTDVTGFGLAGHLMRICESSNVSANIKLNDIPLLDGAEELSQFGVRSSIFLDNREFRKANMTWVPSAKSNLIFDPQTSGGILAAIPKHLEERTIHALKTEGYCSQIIGYLNTGNPFITVT